MIVIDCEQGSREWKDARCGIPTASCFDQVVTPAGGKRGGEMPRTYLAKLVAEAALGVPLDEISTAVLERGKELEPRAASWYEWEHAPKARVREVGFCLTDDRRAGCSPDRLVDDDGLVEIKCPLAKTHAKYLLDPGALVKGYAQQVHGQLWVTGRQWCDLLSYNPSPSLPAVVVRVHRDEKWVESMDEVLREFCDALDAAKALVGERQAEDAEFMNPLA